MPNAMNLIGKVFGQLTVLDRIKDGQVTKYLCRCLCGHVRQYAHGNLMSGNSTSCGCARPVKMTHGHAREKTPTRTYRSWCDMKTRCLNPKSTAWKYYGAGASRFAWRGFRSRIFWPIWAKLPLDGR